MAYVYKLTESEIADELGTYHRGFGIAVFEAESSAPVRIIDDILFDRTVAQELVSLCNRLELSPDHIDDVIADVLSEE